MTLLPSSTTTPQKELLARMAAAVECSGLGCVGWGGECGLCVWGGGGKRQQRFYCYLIFGLGAGSIRAHQPSHQIVIFELVWKTILQLLRAVRCGAEG